MLPTSRLRPITSAFTANGSPWPPWCAPRSPSGRSWTVRAVVTVSSNKRFNAPGTLNSCSQKGRVAPPSRFKPLSGRQVVMVGPTSRSSSGRSSSAVPFTGSRRPCTAPMLSPLHEKRSPRRGENITLFSRERNRISVLPRVPAARITRRVRTFSKLFWRSCKAGSVCATRSDHRPPWPSLHGSSGGAGGRTRSSEVTVARVTSCTPWAWASRSRLRSSESFAPTRQPVKQSPQCWQGGSVSPAKLGPSSSATVSGGTKSSGLRASAISAIARTFCGRAPAARMSLCFHCPWRSTRAPSQRRARS